MHAKYEDPRNGADVIVFMTVIIGVSKIHAPLWFWHQFWFVSRSVTQAVDAFVLHVQWLTWNTQWGSIYIPLAGPPAPLVVFPSANAVKSLSFTSLTKCIELFSICLFLWPVSTVWVGLDLSCSLWPWHLVQGLACVHPTNTSYLYVLGNILSVVHAHKIAHKRLHSLN